MTKRIGLIIFCTLFFAKMCFALDISARSAVLYEPKSKTVLFEKDSRTQREIASTTKILTAVVVLENARLDEVVTVPASCVGIEGTSMYLKENEKLAVSDLLYGLLLRSGNDAAEALAYHVGNGNVSDFVDMMNDVAKRIGMKDSVFKNPSGLPTKGHVSTAYDMAKLAAYAMRIPEFADIVATKEKTAANRLFTNHNKLLRMYNGVNGVKTGFTKAAGRCLVSSAKRDGMNLIAVTLSAPDDWNDHIKLFDYGFENYVLSRFSYAGESFEKVWVVGGEASQIPAVVAGEAEVLLNASDEVEWQICLPRFLYAPVSKGDVVGEIKIIVNGELKDIVSVVSGDSVEEYRKQNFFDKLFNLFKGV